MLTNRRIEVEDNLCVKNYDLKSEVYIEILERLKDTRIFFLQTNRVFFSSDKFRLFN